MDNLPCFSYSCANVSNSDHTHACAKLHCVASVGPFFRDQLCLLKAQKLSKHLLVLLAPLSTRWSPLTRRALAFDHIYSRDPEASLRVWQADGASAAVLYGTAGTACFQEMHHLLKEAVAKQYAEGMTLMPCHYNMGLSC